MKLEGVTCNRDAIGAKIYWTAAGKKRYRLKNNGGSYLVIPRSARGAGNRKRAKD